MIDLGNWKYSMDLTMKYTGQGTLTDATKPGAGSVTYSAGNNSYPGTKAFDDAGNVGSGRWLANAPTNSNPAWIRYDFGVATKISEYMIQSQNYQAGPRAPKNWTLQGSNDNSNWTTLDTQVNKTGWTSWLKRDYTIANPASYRWYKFVFTANNGNGTLGIGEIELKVLDGLYGFPANLTLSENNAGGFKYSQVASSAGRDLRFTDSTGGTLLAYQIDEWLPGGDSRLWVKIPEIKPAAEGNTSITMWWGNENAVSEFPDYVSNGEVWSSYTARYMTIRKDQRYRCLSKPKPWTKTEVTSSPIGVLGTSQFFPEGRTMVCVPTLTLILDRVYRFLLDEIEGKASRTGNNNDLQYHRLSVPKDTGIRSSGLIYDRR